MKKISFGLGAVFACLLFCLRCNSSQEKGAPTESSGTATARPTGQETTSGDTLKKDYFQLGAELLNKERIGKLSIGMGLQQVHAILGGAASKTDLENWGADGRFYSTYSYSSGLSLNMGSDDSTFLGASISSITVNPNCPYTTTRGIGVGNTFEETQNAYKDLIDPAESNDTILVAGSVYGGLIFNFKNGKVNRFFLGAAAE